MALVCRNKRWTPAARLAGLALLVGLTGACEREAEPVTAEEAADVVARLERSRWSRRHAQQRLAASTRRDVWPALLELLREPEESSAAARIAAIRVLSEQFTADFGPPGRIVQMTVGDPDPQVRAVALDTIASWGDPAHRRVLRRAAEEADDPATVETLEAALERLAQQRRHFYRRRVESCADPKDRVLAARHLGMLENPADVAFLQHQYERARRSDLALAQEILMALGRIGTPQAVAFLRRQISASERALRVAAVTTQIDHGDPSVIPALQARLEQDEAPYVRIAAVQALVAIGTDQAAEALQAGCAEPPTPRVRAACQKAHKRL